MTATLSRGDAAASVAPSAAMKLLTLALMLGLATSTAHADKAAPTRDEISAADADKFLAFIDKVATAVTSNLDACPKMGKALHAVADANADVIKMANDAKAAGKKLPKAHEDKMRDKAKAIEPGLTKCKADKTVTAATDRFAKKTKSAPPARP